jgi:hypothetical protein
MRFTEFIYIDLTQLPYIILYNAVLQSTGIIFPDLIYICHLFYKNVDLQFADCTEDLKLGVINPYEAVFCMVPLFNCQFFFFSYSTLHYV